MGQCDPQADVWDVHKRDGMREKLVEEEGGGGRLTAPAQRPSRAAGVFASALQNQCADLLHEVYTPIEKTTKITATTTPNTSYA